MEEDITNENIILISPANNVEMSSSTVSFTWTPIPGAKYRLQIARPDFANPLQIVLDTLVTNSSYSQQLNLGAYEWRVRGENSGYHTSFAVRNFSISNNDDFQNNIVFLQTPTNNVASNIQSHPFSWDYIQGALNYQIQIIDSQSNLIANQITTAPEINLTLPEGVLQWRVRASNGTQETLYSSRNIVIDLTSPNTATLLSPNHNAVLTSNTATFTWDRIAISGSTEKDSIFIYSDPGLQNLTLMQEATSPFETELNPGTYYWNVKSGDLAGNVSNTSITRTFIVN